MLIWVIAYVNAQLGSSQCQNTSARVSECHPTLAPTQRVDRSDKHSPQWAVLCCGGVGGISAITSGVNIKFTIGFIGLQAQHAMQLHSTFCSVKSTLRVKFNTVSECIWSLSDLVLN